MGALAQMRRFCLLVVASFGLTLAASAAPVEVDQPAPEVDVRLLNGKLVKAKSLRGKVVVTMIWATWSPAARMELGEVERLYAAYHAKGLQMLALSIDERAGEVREFWRTRGYTMPVAMRSDAYFDHYGRVSTTPTYYIVDRAGILRHRIAGPAGPERLDALLRPLLAQPPPQSAARH